MAMLSRCLRPGESIDAASLKLKLDAVNKLVPYMKLVEREKLRLRAGAVPGRLYAHCFCTPY